MIYRFDHADGLLSKKTVFKYPDLNVFLAARNPREGEPAKKHQRTPAGLAVTQDGKTLYVSAAFGHSLGRFDAQSGAFQGEIALEADSYPYGLALDESRGRLYVSLWSKAAVAVVDTASFKVVGTWPTQEHPNEMILARKGKILYVANANRNTVTVIDTEAGKPIETIGTAIDPKAPSGSTPNSLALSPDESMLFVANANTNNLAVVNVKEPGASAPLGFIPVGWYPTSVRVARDGKTLYVTNGKGSTLEGQPRRPAAGLPPGGGPTVEYIGGLFQGTLSVIPMPTPSKWRPTRRRSTSAARCVGAIRPASAAPSPPRATRSPRRSATPRRSSTSSTSSRRTAPTTRSSATCPKATASRPSACSPRRSRPTTTPWSASSCCSTTSTSRARSAPTATSGRWVPMPATSSSGSGRSAIAATAASPIPPEGNVFEIAKPAGGYIWDKAAEKGVSYRSYGEFVANAPTPSQPATTPVKALEGHFDPMFRSFDMDYPDAKRADRFLEELAGFEKSGEMPRLVILKLPNDHTSGTSAGKWTVTACVGDNDLALGRVVEGLSKSRFWKQMAIFVVEDDAQNGSDHVDAHRTVALAISPYIKRHSVDSTMYSTSSMLRTMELILGLEPMSQFDASARPMFASFTNLPDFTPYVHRPAGVDLNARNRRDAPDGRGLAAAQPRDRGPQRRHPLQRDHLEGRQGEGLGDAAAGPGGVRGAAVIGPSSLSVANSHLRPFADRGDVL